MALTYNDDQKALSQTVKRFVSERSSMSTVREVIDSEETYSEQAWKQIAGDLGLAALAIPEEYDGGDGTQSDVAAALRELGAGLVPSPILGSAVLATGALLALSDENLKKDLLPKLAAGEITGALAISEPSSRSWIPAEPKTTANGSGDSVTITGEKSAVLNGADANFLLVQASGSDGVGIYLVEADAKGVSRKADRVVDPTLGVASVTFDNAPAKLVSGDAAAALDKVVDQANIAVCALQSGAIAHCLDMTIDYAKNRYSFGQPIGAYQGVKHKIADMYTAHQLADSQLKVATDALDSGADDASVEITAARVLFNPLYVQVARNTQLLHGGIGFTWEHDAHFFTKNAMAYNTLLGDSDYQQERLADKLSI